MPIIEIEGLSKKYALPTSTPPIAASLRENVTQSIRRGISRLWQWDHSLVPPSIEIQSFWALKGVSLTIEAGERIAFMGQNGAGKSTLLKILARITSPTEGRIAIRGRVASLLEVGTGFHPDLTGRENIFVNGAILGMSYLEMKRKFEEIVSFSELEPFLDLPVKRYSSGMYMRLGFAIAIHVDADILILDEVLAVGDSPFQEKCLEQLRQKGREGKTLLFVSHHLPAVQTLCQRGIFLEKGQICWQGDLASCPSSFSDRLLARHPTD